MLLLTRTLRGRSGRRRIVRIRQMGEGYDAETDDPGLHIGVVGALDNT